MGSSAPGPQSGSQGQRWEGPCGGEVGVEGGLPSVSLLKWRDSVLPQAPQAPHGKICNSRSPLSLGKRAQPNPSCGLRSGSGVEKENAGSQREI